MQLWCRAAAAEMMTAARCERHSPAPSRAGKQKSVQCVARLWFFLQHAVKSVKGAPASAVQTAGIPRLSAWREVSACAVTRSIRSL